MMAALFSALYFAANPDRPGSFSGFSSFMMLFFATGIDNASTFQMIPAIMNRIISRAMPLCHARNKTS